MTAEGPFTSSVHQPTLAEEAFFFDLSLDLLAVVGLDGYFKRINPMFSQILGYSDHEFLTRPFLDFVHPDDRAATLAEMEQLKGGTPTLAFENRYLTREGDYRWLSWTASPQIDRAVIYCIARDVTQQKQTAMALRVSEERWQLALRGSNDGIWDWNVQTNEVFFSARWKTMLGYGEDEISHHLEEWAKRVHPEDRAWVMQAIQDHFDQKTPFYVTEHRVQCKDGGYKWILDRGQAIWDQDGKVWRMVGSHTDVTERKTLEAALHTANETLEQRVAQRTAELEQINRSLQASELKFRTAIEHIPDVFVIYDAHRRIQFVNRAGLALSGGSLPDFLGRRDEEIFPVEVTQTYLPLLQQAIATKRYQTGECTIALPNREPYTIVVQYVPLLDGNGEIQQIFGISHDITRRKQAEIALQQSQAQVQRQLAEIETIYQSAPIGLNVLDTDLRFVRINQRLADMNGFSVEEHLGKTIRDLLPDLADTAEALLRPILATGEPLLNVEIRGETPAQPGVQRIWLESFLPLKQDDRVIGISTVCEEITERKQAEGALRQSEERYRTLFETMEDGFCVIEILFDANQTPIDYRFLEINPAFEQQTGLHQAVGKTARQMIPNLEDFWFETYGRVALTGEPLRFENGSAVMNRWFEVYAFPLGQPEQHKVALLFKEISERKHLEAERQQAEAHREQLLRQEQAARAAAERANRIKDEFLAVLSHELRTPLNPILGWSKLLQSPQISAQKLQQGLATIERNAKQQVQLIDDLLDTSRIIRGQLSLNLAVINLSEPILAALETVRLSAEAKGIMLEVKLSCLGQVRGDGVRLQQVVWNLLSNAIKFTPPGGRITVRLSQVERLAQIQVRDNGKGIQPQFLPHVFELFRQEDSSTTRSFGGLGLGLAIARQVVEAHGGTIMAASEGEGQGATFTVLLPLIPAAITNIPADPQPPALNIEQLRVMVVDDEADSLEVVKVVLEQQGAIVQALPSAVKALQILTQDPFDLLVSDIGMPEMDGYTFIRQVRTLPSSLNRNIPAIALSAYASDMDQHQALSTGYQFHLAKPLEPGALVRAITRLGLTRPD